MKSGVAYVGVRDLDYVKQDMENLVSHGYTHVLHPYSEADFEYNRVLMREMFEISTEAGLKVYTSPHGIGRVFEGDSLSELAGRNSEQSQINSRGKSLVASCINHPDFQAYMRAWVEEVSDTVVETISWENPNFYLEQGEEAAWSCRCETCQKLFRKKTKHLMPNSLTKSVNEFRVQSVLELMSELTGVAHLKQKRNSICLDNMVTSDAMGLKEKFAELPTIDEISIKPYWTKGAKPSIISQEYHESSKKLIELCERFKVEPQVWIKNFSIVKNNEQSVAEATYASYNEGIRNIFCWAYKGSQSISSLRCDEPDKVWKTQTDTYAECHEKAIMNEMVNVIKATKS